MTEPFSFSTIREFVITKKLYFSSMNGTIQCLSLNRRTDMLIIITIMPTENTAFFFYHCYDIITTITAFRCRFHAIYKKLYIAVKAMIELVTWWQWSIHWPINALLEWMTQPCSQCKKLTIHLPADCRFKFFYIDTPYNHWKVTLFCLVLTLKPG